MVMKRQKAVAVPRNDLQKVRHLNLPNGGVF